MKCKKMVEIFNKKKPIFTVYDAWEGYTRIVEMDCYKDCMIGYDENQNSHLLMDDDIQNLEEILNNESV